jgi:hypothetical protein
MKDFFRPSTNYKFDGLVKSQRHQLLEKIGCSEHRVLKGTRVSNGLMTPKSDCILHPVDFLRVHHDSFHDNLQTIIESKNGDYAAVLLPSPILVRLAKSNHTQIHKN